MDDGFDVQRFDDDGGKGFAVRIGCNHFVIIGILLLLLVYTCNQSTAA